MKNIRGFTFLELMIVVAVIGILVAVTIPTLREYVAESHGGAAMKGIAEFVNKAQVCVQGGGGCGSLAAEIVGVEELMVSGSPALGTALELQWDEGVCVVEASISGDGSVVYSAKASATALDTLDSQCQHGAGL